MNVVQLNPLPMNVLLVMRVLADHGYEARVAGGAVRDLQLGLKPKDWDLATTARPEVVMSAFRDAGYNVVETGLQHGTVTVMVNGEGYEVTTLRVDMVTDGRHAEVMFTDNWLEDARRRDFTVNAMFMDADGRVWDFFNGMADLNDNVVRFVEDADRRVKEDYLRMLRWFRFMGRLGTMEADSDAMEAVSNNAAGLQQVSAERVWSEMKQVLTGSRVRRLLELMKELGVLEHTRLPCWQQFEPALASAVHSVSANDVEVSPVTVLAGGLRYVMLKDNTAFAKDVAEKLKMSGDEHKLFRFLMENKKYVDLDWKLKELAVEDGNTDRVVQLALLSRNLERHRRLLEWTPPVFPVKGQDLLDNGMSPGPNMGKALSGLREMWYGSDFSMTREQLLEHV